MSRRYTMNKRTIVLIGLLLLIQSCSSVESDAGNDDVKSVNYSIFNSEFDLSQHKLHTIKVSNEIAAPFSSSETQLFFLIANELHWINDVGAMVKLGRFVDVQGDEKILNFMQIKASKWKDQIIFVADVEHNYYVYIVSILSKNDQASTNATIPPIQTLKKHGQALTISFFDFEQDLYCLLGSNSIEEKRSELRFLKWARSYFQVIETIMNRNHAIDLVKVSARHNLILIVHNKEGVDDDTTIQVHRYQAIDKIENDVNERELITERIQDIFVPYTLSASNMFFYSDTGTQHLYMITCNGPALVAISNSLCEFYTWKRDGIAESTRFQRLQRFPLSEAIASMSEHLQSIANNTKIFNLDSLLIIQNGNSVYAYHGQADSRSVEMSDNEMNIIDILLEKKLTSDSKSIAHNLISIYRDPNTQSIDLTVRTLKLFEDKIPDATVNAANIMVSGNVPKTSGDIANELSRIKELLIDLRSHLISENEQFLKPMQSKITSMKQALQLRQALQSGAIGPEPISIYCSQLKIAAPPNDTQVDAIILHADQNHLDASLADTYERLKKINTTPSMRAKRSTGTEETIHVRRLTIKSENHSFKGILLKNNSMNNLYQLNGRLKTKTLRINRVSGNNSSTNIATATPLDSIVGDAGNFHGKIYVKSINGADWNGFVSSLYRKGRNTPINGNIVLTHPTSIRRLFTKELNDVSPDDYLTIGTDQQIDSSVFISKIHVNEIQSNVINNMQRFAEYVALIGRDNIVDTRVKIFVCNVSNSLQLSDKEGEEMTQHIVGTRMEDLSQIYNGRIVIKGSLSLQNLQLINADFNVSPFAPIDSDPSVTVPSAQIVVDGTPFDLRSISQLYWMKSLDQNFADVTFTQPIITPQLNADFLLTHPTDEYFVLSEKNESPNQLLPLHLFFAGETTVTGHLTSAEPMSTTLQILSQDAVRRGTRITLSSPITFSGHLLVDEIVMLFDTDQFVHRYRSAPLFDSSVRKEFTGIVYIADDLTVSSVESADIIIDNFNDHQSLRNTFDTMILIDQTQSVGGTLIFDGHLFVNNFTVSAFIDNANNNETTPYDSIFDVNNLLGEIFNLRENRIEYLQLNGNVQFVQSDRLSIGTFNGLPLTDYLALVVSQQRSNETIQIFGTKTFASDVTMQIVSVSSFNRQINVDDWMGNSLRLQSNPRASQVIDGNGWIIDELITENFEVRGTINGVRMPIQNHPAEFSDVIFIDETEQRQPINIWSSLLFMQGIQFGFPSDVSSTRIANCDITKLFGGDSIELTQTNWNSVIVANAATIPYPSASQPTKSISEFFRDAVLSGKDQLIGGSGQNITIKTNRKIIFNRIGTIPTVKSQQPLINGVNLIDLYADAVTKTIVSVDGVTQPISIEGKKEFLHEYVLLNGHQTICAANINANNVGGVDIVTLNETLIRQTNDDLVMDDGHKLVFLKSITVERLDIDEQSTINGVTIDDIFFIYDKTNRTPQIAFAQCDEYNPSSVCVNVLNDLNLNTVNELSLKYFLENRVRKYIENGAATADTDDMQLISGYLTFDNLIVSGSQTKIDVINDILCDDVVIPAPDDNGEQQINGFKEIVGDLYVYQPFHTWKINGIDVMGSYAKTVFLDQDQTLEQLSIREPYHLDATALTIRNKINGIALPKEVDYSVVAARSDSTDDDDDVVGAPPAKRLNYIDVSNDFNIAFNETDLFNVNNANDVHHTWLTIDSFYSEIVHNKNVHNESESVCPVQYHIQLEERTGKQWLVVRRAAIRRRLLTLTLNAKYVVHIHTEFPPAINYYSKCNFQLFQSGEQPLTSRIFINYKQRLRYPNEYIENAHIFKVPKMKRVYLIVHLFNSSVAILRSSMVNDTQPWHQVQTISLVTNSRVSKIFNVQLFEWQRRRVLIIAQSSPSINDKSKTGTEHLKLYCFNESSEQFELSSKIDGDFNVISSILIEQRPTKPTANASKQASELHLILAKKGGRAAQIWKADDRSTVNINFQFVRDLKFDGGIESLSIFSEHEMTYLSIILNDGHFYIYQYRMRDRFQEMFSPVWINLSASNWQKKMVGHLGSVKAMVPFTARDKLYLFVFMNENPAIQWSGDDSIATEKLPNRNKIAKVFTLYYY